MSAARGTVVIAGLAAVAIAANAAARPTSTRATSTAQAPVHVKHTSEIFRFGGDNAPRQYLFASTPALVVARDGTIYARVMDDATVFVYKPDGTFIRNIGRRGQGPGEFESAVSHGLLGDTLWIGNFPTPRISRMLVNGKHLETSLAVFPPPPGVKDVMPIPIVAMMQQGIVVAKLPRRRIGNCDTARMPVVVARKNAAAHPDTIAQLELDGLHISCIGDWPGLGVIAHSPSIAIASNGSGFAVLSWSDDMPGTFTVRSLAPDGKQRWSRTMRVDRAVEIPRSVRDSIIDNALTRARPQIDAAEKDHRVTAAPKKLVADGLDIPRYYPPVRRVLVGTDGTTWIEQTVDLQGGTWIALDATGTMLFRVLVPHDMVVQQASASDMWGVATDSLGIAYMIKRHIVD